MTKLLRVRCPECGVFDDVTLDDVKHKQADVVELVRWYTQIAGIKEPVRCRWVRARSFWLGVRRYGSAKAGYRFVVEIDVSVLTLPWARVHFLVAHEVSEIQQYYFSEAIERLHDAQAKLLVTVAHKAVLLPPTLICRRRLGL